MSENNMWTDEDGECYFSQGHHDVEEMKRRAVALEKECLGTAYPEPDDLEELIADSTLSHFWIIDCDWREGHSHVVAEGTPKVYEVSCLAR